MGTKPPSNSCGRSCPHVAHVFHQMRGACLLVLRSAEVSDRFGDGAADSNAFPSKYSTEGTPNVPIVRMASRRDLPPDSLSVTSDMKSSDPPIHSFKADFRNAGGLGARISRSNDSSLICPWALSMHSDVIVWRWSGSHDWTSLSCLADLPYANFAPFQLAAYHHIRSGAILTVQCSS